MERGGGVIAGEFTRITGTPRNARADDVNQLIDAANGDVGKGRKWRLTDFSSSSEAPLKVKNPDASVGPLLQLTRSDDVDVLFVDRNRITMGKPLRGSSLAGGLWVDANGRVGMFDQATGATLAVDSSFVATKASAINEVFWDEQLVHTYPGAQVTTGTASAGGATTLTVAGTPWVVNAYAGKIVHLTAGTGSAAADPYRYVVSNTNNTLTVSLAWTVNPAAATTFEIVTAGDSGARRTIFWAFPGQVASSRAVEIQAIRQEGSGDAGLKGIELGIHTEVTGWDAGNNVGIDLFSSSAFANPAKVKRAGIGINIYGDAGWDEFLRMANTAGATEAKIASGGVANFGANTAGLGTVPRVSINQSANGGTDGLRINTLNSITNYAHLYASATVAAVLVSQVAGSGTGQIAVSGNPSIQTLVVSSPSSLNNDLLNLDVGGVGTVFSVDKAGIPNWATANGGTGAGGAAATNGNVSASAATGPTTAAASEWIKIKYTGNQRWIRAWT